MNPVRLRYRCHVMLTMLCALVTIHYIILRPYIGIILDTAAYHFYAHVALYIAYSKMNQT